MTTTNRILHLDLIRAFSMLGIIFAHTAQYFFDLDTTVWFSLFIGSASLFFMTSGALIFPIKKQPGEWLKHRLSRILPLFLIVSIIYALLAYHFEQDTTYSLKDHIIWGLFAPSWGVGWFIYALVGLYLFAPVISPWLEGASRRNVEYFLILWALSGLIEFAFQHIWFVPQETFLAPFFNYSGYMVAGYYLTRWPLQERSTKARTCFFAITFIVGVVFALRATVTGLRWGYARIFTNDLSINIMAFNMLVFALFSYVKSSPKFIYKAFTLVSVNSFGIYLCHMAIIKYALLPLQLDAWTTIALTFVGSIAVGYCLTKLNDYPVAGLSAKAKAQAATFGKGK